MHIRPNTLSFSLFLVSSSALALDADLDLLMSMSLEDLSMLEVNVTSASKREQSISDIPAAIYVITNERIVRSGVKSIADVLSLAPGIEVSQFNESSDFVSSRGFHDGLFNKMLVMIDGRSVFSPMYGGAFWEDIDYILADIERIEIIRGPSGTIWGGNAVNGVINIITKSTKDTLGSYGQIAYGQHGYKEASVRHGLQFNDKVTARAFYKAKDTFTVIDEYQSNYDTDEYNTISTQTAGVKFEMEGGDQFWMFSFGGETSEQYYDWFTVDYTSIPGVITDSYKEVSSSSYFFQVAHKERFDQAEWQTNFWYWADEDNAPDANGSFKTIDIDSFVTLTLGFNTSLLLGVGARYTEIQLQDINKLNVKEMDFYNRYAKEPNSYDTTTNLYSQIEHKFNNQFSVQFGIKAEYFTLNDSFELSPQLRGLYAFSDEQNVWFGIGKATVTPSYFEQKTVYYSYDYHSDTVFSNLANSDLNNENVITIDTGYRLNVTNFSFDFSAYISHYENIRGSDNQGWLDDGKGNYFLASQANDDYEAKTYGTEIAVEWNITPSLKNHMSYSYLSFSQDRVEGDLSNPDYDDYYQIDHQNMVSNQLLWQVTDHIQWDFVLRYKDIYYKESYIDTDDLISLDTRLGWQKHQYAPLVEVIITNIGMSGKCDLETYTYNNSCRAYETEQSVYGRVSYEF